MVTETKTNMTESVVNSLLNQIAQAALREANKDAIIADLSQQLQSCRNCDCGIDFGQED